jgi:hypothetical protein
VALQSFWILAASHVGGFLNYFRHMVGLLGWVISPLQGLYLHRTTQHKKTRTDIFALSGTRTHDPSNQPAKTHALDCTATVTGALVMYSSLLSLPSTLNVTATNCCNSLVNNRVVCSNSLLTVPVLWLYRGDLLCVARNAEFWIYDAYRCMSS